MGMKNRFLILTGIFMAMLFGITGCRGQEYAGLNAGDGKIQIVCTTFPLYDWTRQIAGSDNDNIDITYLLKNGADIHSYQATAADVALISSCDVIIYTGGQSEEWIDEIIKNPVNKDIKAVKLMDILGDGIKEEEIVDGMQHEEHGHDEEEYDEHVWLSVKNAVIFCNAIEEALSGKDPDRTLTYHTNTENYVAELQRLDGEFESLVNKSVRNVLLFGDRFPFRYLTDDYGISYYAAFPGCSAETEASFETVTYLAGKLDEENIPVVLVIENSDKRIAQTIINNTRNKNAGIVEMNSMQSVPESSIGDGVTYIKLMEENYDALTQALK